MSRRYVDLVLAARGLWDDTTLDEARERNPEYLRGQVELIRDTARHPALDLDDNLDGDEVRALIEQDIFRHMEARRQQRWVSGETGGGYSLEYVHLTTTVHPGGISRALCGVEVYSPVLVDQTRTHGAVTKCRTCEGGQS